MSPYRMLIVIFQSMMGNWLKNVTYGYSNIVVEITRTK
jgi:hypothetical protein